MGSESPELIEQQMQETRASLAEKVSALETQVMGTIQTASDAVTNIVDSVKTVVPDTIASVKESVDSVKDTLTDTVSEAADSVKSAFDLSHHTRNHPWAMVGGATAVGFAVGWLSEALRPARPSAGWSAAYGTGYTPDRPGAGYATPAPPPSGPTMPSWLDNIIGPLLARAGQELRTIAESAISQAASSLKETVQDQVPKLIGPGAFAGQQPQRPGGGPGEHPGRPYGPGRVG